MVANYQWQNLPYGELTTSLAYNFNRNEVTNVDKNPDILNALGVNLTRLDRREQYGLLAGSTPEHKFSLANDYKIGNLLEINQKLNIAEYDNKNYHVECRKCWAKEFCNECTWNIFSQGICEEKCEQNRKIIAYILLSIANFSEKTKKNGSSKYGSKTAKFLNKLKT